MKAKFIALAALVLGMVSCQQDFDGAAQVGGEVDFQLAVAAPELAGTRADGDGKNGHNSAYGAIDYLSETDWANVDLRYTLEVYDAENVTADPVKDRMVMIVDKYTPVTFDLRLVPNRPYRFVVFADFVGDGNAMEKAAVADKTTAAHGVEGEAPLTEEERERRMRMNYYGTVINVGMSILAALDDIADKLVTVNNNIVAFAEKRSEGGK
jgi:hypothetical protein